MKTKASLHTAFASCTFELQAEGAAIQLFPAGAFSARDGRPADVDAGHWYIDGQVAARVLASASARATDLVIDYEHQTLACAENGKPAPAAGWIKGAALEWREGQGLFATAPEWTENAAAYIKAREYRYLSPVFTYDTRTGAVLELLHVGLTNNPALDGMASLPALAAARFELAIPAAPSAQENQRVNREQLIEALGLSSDASDEDIQTALTALKANASKADDLQQSLAALKAERKPDPAKFAPIEVVEALKQDIAALKANQVEGEVGQLVKAGLEDGRLLPAQESWARELGQTNLAALKGYLEKTPAIAALKGRQTDGRQPQDNPHGLSDVELQAAALTGLSPEAFAKAKGA
ncbi:phage protease [Stutzerimonas balearica]|uniref:phage protease n=1 Tax=Stutzerimonas balearica TaxID=74829 RepID=UPI0028B17FF5|nr:phage protease [Stutzerimonas balearica]